MPSNYFKLKTQTEDFKNYVNKIFEEFQGKKILIYGAGKAFIGLNKQYNLERNLNIVAIADKKFENKKHGAICNIKAIAPFDIKNEEFDFILITNEYYEPINQFLIDTLNIPEEKIRIILKEDIIDERVNLNYLGKLNFEKTLPKLIKKLKNKKVVLYGAESRYFKAIQKYYDISGLNIIAIADQKYANHKKPYSAKYQTCAPENIKELKPDCILITTKYYIDIMELLYTRILGATYIKVMPLVKKSLLTLIKEC